MTPKEKAEDLIMKFSNPFAKSCALIAVDEIIKSNPISPLELSHPALYWQEVKQEIEKL